MQKTEMQRLLKLEERMMQIATEELELELCGIEFDIIPPQKMLEIMAYRQPTNISSWKYGRDYEKLRTIYDRSDKGGLPYEVVINSDPARAYLMKENTIAVQALVMAHVIGHVNFFTENEYFKESKKDIVHFMHMAQERFNSYERRFGIDEVERIVDAGHALQFHSSPFEHETEEEKIERIYQAMKKQINVNNKSSFNDLIKSNKRIDIQEDIELANQKLLRALKLQTPVEPTEDLLRYIVDNSTSLEDWHKDILEILRTEGQYYWPIIRTKYMNEGWATFIHERIMNQLFDEELLTTEEHASYNYSNSMVKAEHPFAMNPYQIGSGIWKNIEERWNKGKHGDEWDRLEDYRIKDNWDKQEGKGWEKCKDIMSSYQDWFFMQDFLTPDMITELNIYIFQRVDQWSHYDYIATKQEAKKVAKLIIDSFAHSTVPKIEIVDGNSGGNGELFLRHSHSGVDLNKTYAEKTLQHIWNLWKRPIALVTKRKNQVIEYHVDGSKILRKNKLEEKLNKAIKSLQQN